ncbi:hypothetical protein [Myxococcus sp. RHSTA-1-4]|uniref:hypothetical protein n=1 Tax=Myxococcus sp. RHSTA-1-4 TaxID=2874601 RepID=UPI001CBF9326|nr:hypothetical protein [Myxococcus sp. RHSTA-1-4]
MFEQHRQLQYTRELLFSTEVDLMALVARDELKVSMQALDEKVNHTEPWVARQVVQGCGERLTPVLEQLKSQQRPWAAGYWVRELDGNHLAASQKRLKSLRGFRGAALPGQSRGQAHGLGDGIRTEEALGTARRHTWANWP